jgi:VWFA-related protein
MQGRTDRRTQVAVLGLMAAAMAGAATLLAADASTPQQPLFRFRTGVEWVRVTATVIDGQGRFVEGLRREDFAIYEDGEPQKIADFSHEQVPVSLGVALDTSDSMAGEKIQAARRALDRFLFGLLNRADEVFVYRFDNDVELIADWTADRRSIQDALARAQPRGGTALYDAVAEAVPLAQSGRHPRKAVLIISDGNDTSSRTDVQTLRQQIRQSEVLVYAIGIDGEARSTLASNPGSGIPRPLPPWMPIPSPFPRPGGPRAPIVQPPQPRPPWGGWSGSRPRNDARVDIDALREITDENGGRTEIIRTTRDLAPATASIADELNKQYLLGYETTRPKDGRWHSIRVELRQGRYVVRARRGYVATP